MANKVEMIPGSFEESDLNITVGLMVDGEPGYYQFSLPLTEKPNDTRRWIDAVVEEYENGNPKIRKVM